MPFIDLIYRLHLDLGGWSDTGIALIMYLVFYFYFLWILWCTNRLCQALTAMRVSRSPGPSHNLLIVSKATYPARAGTQRRGLGTERHDPQ